MKIARRTEAAERVASGCLWLLCVGGNGVLGALLLGGLLPRLAPESMAWWAVLAFGVAFAAGALLTPLIMARVAARRARSVAGLTEAVARAVGGTWLHPSAFHPARTPSLRTHREGVAVTVRVIPRDDVLAPRISMPRVVAEVDRPFPVGALRAWPAGRAPWGLAVGLVRLPLDGPVSYASVDRQGAVEILANPELRRRIEELVLLGAPGVVELSRGGTVWRTGAVDPERVRMALERLVDARFQVPQNNHSISKLIS